MNWLAASICLLFVAESAWMFYDYHYMVTHDGWGTATKASTLFNALNFLLFALIGGLCLVWPLVSGWFECSQKKERDTEKSSAPEGKACAAENVVVVVESKPKQADEVKISIDQDDAKAALKDLEKKESSKFVEIPMVQDKASEQISSAAADHGKPSNAPAKKRQLVYLTNMKTFLTFFVVTHHTFCVFENANGVGMGMDAGTVGSFPMIMNWYTTMDQNYFMAAFFLISAYFCPKSLDRKGFRAFVIDKIVRLGGPFILWSMLLGPVLTLWQYAYAGFGVHYIYTEGPPWFILWLLNFSIIYAVVAQVLPSLHFKMPHPLLLLVLGLGLGGAFYGLGGNDADTLNMGTWNYFGGMNMWTYGIALYIPFFIAGIAGGRNDWLRDVENMATWVVWCLRITCVGFWVLYFFAQAQWSIPDGLLSSVHINQSLEQISTPVYAIAMTLAEMQLFYQYFNSSPQSKFMKNAGLAAYTVYVIHPWVLDTFVLALIEIFKAANLQVAFDQITGSGNAEFSVMGANGEHPNKNLLWPSWLFVFVLTQLVVWPLAHYFRKLPMMNKML